MLRTLPTRAPVLLAALTLLAAGLIGCGATDPQIAGARAELQQGNFEAALAMTDEALMENPDNPQTHELRGDIYAAMMAQAATDEDRQQYARQLAESYQRAVALDPSNQLPEVKLMQIHGETMARGAEAYDSGGDDQLRFIEAASQFGAAAAMMPDSSDAHFFQGISLIQAGETTSAIPPLEAAVETGIDDPTAHIYLSQLYLMEDRADDALLLLENARADFPESEDIETELLNTYARTGQIDRAIEAYADAVQEQPDDAVMQYNYGSFLLQASRFEEAAEHLARATELDPQAGNAFYNLGAAYMNQAVALNEELTELDDHTTDEALQLQAQRDALLTEAVVPLEEARSIFEADGQEVEDVCMSLFRAYALLRMDAEARTAAECANIELD